MNKKSFEKAFKLAIPNFDETKIWFKHKAKSYQESEICFVLDGKLKKLPMYKSQDNINLWKNYFIEFLATGNFDYNGYWELYSGNNKSSFDNNIYKFPLTSKNYNQFNIHTDEMFKFLQEKRAKYGDLGIRQVPKPDYTIDKVLEKKEYLVIDKDYKPSLLTKSELNDLLIVDKNINVYQLIDDKLIKK
jgi:hypothetical protein